MAPAVGGLAPLWVPPFRRGDGGAIRLYVRGPVSSLSRRDGGGCREGAWWLAAGLAAGPPIGPPVPTGGRGCGAARGDGGAARLDVWGPVSSLSCRDGGGCREGAWWLAAGLAAGPPIGPPVPTGGRGCGAARGDGGAARLDVWGPVSSLSCRDGGGCREGAWRLAAGPPIGPPVPTGGRRRGTSLRFGGQSVPSPVGTEGGENRVAPVRKDGGHRWRCAAGRVYEVRQGG